MNDIAGRVAAIDRQLEQLHVAPADASQKAAVLVLIASTRIVDLTQPVGKLLALEALLPAIDGLVREHAEYLIARSEQAASAMPFYSAA